MANPPLFLFQIIIFFIYTQSLFAMSHPPNQISITISVFNFGVVGDGISYDTIPIQRESSWWYVVLAENAADVGIRVVDGQTEKFVVRENPRKNVMVSWNQTGACLGDECRPRLVGFLDSMNVRVSNITLNQPAYWWGVLLNSNYVCFSCKN